MDDFVWRVVHNDEMQYSIWPTFRAVPDGWTTTEKTGTEEECLAYIEQVWTDLRPLSIRGT